MDYWKIILKDIEKHSRKSIVDDLNELAKHILIQIIKANGLSLNIRSIYKKDNTNKFIKLLKKYYEFN